MSLAPVASRLHEGCRSAAAARVPLPRLLLAVSGGPDSIALCLAAARWRDADPAAPAFTAATVDHGLRPEGASEALFAAGVCRDLGLDHRILRWHPGAIPGNLPAAARAARYRLLAGEARRVGASAVVTAHHEDDQVETHILARERGAAGPGLAGMRPWRDLEPGLLLLRPLLGLRKADLDAARHEAGLVAIDDPTNRDLRFRRPAIRRDLELGLRDRSPCLPALAEAGRQRSAADRRVADRLRALCEAGLLVLTPAGEIVIERGGEVEAGILSRCVTAAGGAQGAPSSAALGRLAARLRQAAPSVSTLGGCRIAGGPAGLRFSREWGREGPRPVPLDGAPVTFDNRFDLLPGRGEGTWVRSLGDLGRGHARDRTLPVVTDDSGLVRAVHPSLAACYPQAAILAVRPRLGWRVWANLPGPAPAALTDGPQNAANPREPVGKDLADTYLR